MFSDQMETITRTSAQTSIWPELVLIFKPTVKDHNAPLETGPPSTGLEDLKMEELLLTLRPKVTKDQRPSPLVTIKYSNAGILLSPNLDKVIASPLTAHHTMPMVMLTPGHQLVENQSHFILISISNLRSLNAVELQNSFNNHHNQ